MISYQLSDANIFIVVFSDEITFNDVEGYLIEFSSIENLPSNILLLYDFTDADFKIPPNKLNLLAEYADNATKKYRSVKTAFYVREPLITAYSYLFTEMTIGSSTKRKVFSTIEAAKKWLQN